MTGIQRFIELTFPITILLWLVAAGMFSVEMKRRTAALDMSNQYRSALMNVKKEEVRRYVLISGEKVAGETTLTITPEEDGSYVITNEINGLFTLFSVATDYSIVAKAYIGGDNELEHFTIGLEVEGGRYEVNGKAVENENGQRYLDIEFLLAGIPMKNMRINAPEGSTISDSLMPVFRMSKPVPGTKWINKMVDPFTQKIRKVEYSVLDIDELPGSDGTVVGYPLIVKMGKMVFHIYVDEDGEVLYEETPLGVTLIRRDIARELGYGFQELSSENPVDE